MLELFFALSQEKLGIPALSEGDAGRGECGFPAEAGGGDSARPAGGGSDDHQLQRPINTFRSCRQGQTRPANQGEMAFRQ